MIARQDSPVSDASGTRSGAARGRLCLLVAGVAPAVAAVVASGLEWGRLLVNGRLVVIDSGLSLWQGMVVLIAAVAGAVVMALSIAAGRARVASLAALVPGMVIAAVATEALVWLVARPADLADRVRAGAEAIALKGYVVPPIESILGPGGWIALAAGLLMMAAGLLGLVVPAWRARRGAADGG